MKFYAKNGWFIAKREGGTFDVNILKVVDIPDNMMNVVRSDLVAVSKHSLILDINMDWVAVKMSDIIAKVEH